MKLGAQLYTVREQMKTTEQIEAGLKRIAEIGYDCVQASGIGRYEPAWLKQVCDGLGLEIAVTHIPAENILGDTAGVIADHDAMNCKYIGLGSMSKNYRGSAQGVYDFKKNYARAINEMKAAGKVFTYHNHAFEFERIGGRTVMDLMLETFSPDEMMITLDCYWVNYGGGDVCEWIDRLSGRIDCVHLKDYGILNNEIAMMPVGEGNMDYPKIIEHLKAAGVKYALVEQDRCNGDDPFDCLERSYNYLKKYF